MPQDGADENPFQVHQTGWYPRDFTERHYKVAGIIGPFFLKREYRPTSYTKYLLVVAQALSYLFQPFFQFFPSAANQMICAKRTDRIW
jgi:hypothetical protein